MSGDIGVHRRHRYSAAHEETSFIIVNNTSDKEHDRDEMRAKEERRGKFWTARTAMSGPEGGKTTADKDEWAREGAQQQQHPHNNKTTKNTTLQKHDGWEADGTSVERDKE